MSVNIGPCHSFNCLGYFQNLMMMMMMMMMIVILCTEFMANKFDLI